MDKTMLVLPWMFFWGLISVIFVIAIIRVALGIPVIGGKNMSHV
jgi:hypothetical protein